VTERQLSPRALRVADRARRLVWRVWGPKTVGVRGIVPDPDGRVLLVRHTYGPNQWHLPGGGVKRRESLLDALVRELREEVGVVVEGPVRLHGVFSNLTEGKSDHIVVCVVDRWRRAGSDSSEIDSLGFFAPDALPPETSGGTRRRVTEWAAGDQPSFDW
jgi:ADP-ribose pyrophosphatase YjhB (NUDIX family)